MSKPLCIDLFAGLGGWAEGFLAEGYDVIGFDIERWPYPGQLVLQDVLTLHGSQFQDAAIIVASPPCQAYSYRAMPWKRAKALPPPDNTLFNACFRIQREASAAAGHKIPMIVENVRGAQKWVGRAKWRYGSYYLWGDVPALMPMTGGKYKSTGMNWSNYGKPGYSGQDFTRVAGKQAEGLKVGRNFHQFEKTGIPSASFHGAPHEKSVQRAEEIKNGGNGTWFGDYEKRKIRGGNIERLSMTSSRSDARKQASALIAKIPFPLAQHLARVFKPTKAVRDYVLADLTG